ncbi:MAG: dimethylsulfoniopropionate demethylase [Pseudomonadota bacterium]
MGMDHYVRLNPSNRLRRSPLFDRVRAEGAKAYSVYNRTLISQWFGTLEEDYAHLKTAVQVWDVGGERIVEISGPDARRLIQMATPRDLSRLGPERCAYVPMVDPQGRLLNDPVLTLLAPDRYWLALADSDMFLYLKGLAAGAGLDVTIFEPDVWIIAIQGPRSYELAERVWGGMIHDIGFFKYGWVNVGGKPMVLARSGWSVQGGFELHVDGSDYALPIWEKIMEAGRDLDVRAGCPNLIERIEAGLLSYGNDISVDHTPFEAGLERFCHLEDATDCLARETLLAAREPARQIRPVEISGDKVPPVAQLWPVRTLEGESVGKVSSACWSPEQQTNVAIAMIDRAYWQPGTRLVVDAPDSTRELVVAEKFWGRT